MPIYEYQCDACGKRFEHLAQKFSDPPAEICALCGKGPVRRLLSSPAIQFKGSGFYITDYAKKDHTDAAKADSAAGEKATTDKKDGDKKSERKTGEILRPSRTGNQRARLMPYASKK